MSGKPEERVATATMETESAKSQRVNELRERKKRAVLNLRSRETGAEEK